MKSKNILGTALLCCFMQSMGFATSKAAADYVVYHTEEGEISIASGLDGKVVTSGEDASTVIQKGIDLLPVSGGKIYISAGTYMLTSTLHIEDKNGVHIEGAARGIVFGPGNEGTVLRSDQAIDMIEIFGNKLKVAGVSISNLYLVGSGKNNGKSGILVKGRSDLLSLHNVGAHNHGIGFYLKGGVVDAPQIQFCDPQVNGIGLKIESSHYSKIVGGEFSDNDEYGIVISGSSDDIRHIQGVKISNVTGVRNGKAGILIGKFAHNISITGGSDFGGTRFGSGIVVSNEGTESSPKNIIIDGVYSYNNATASVLIDKAEHVIISNNILSVHEHRAVRKEVDDNGQEYGIWVKHGSEDVVIDSNIIYGFTQNDILDETGKVKVN